MDPVTLMAILGGTSLALQGTGLGLGMLKSNPMQIPQSGSPNLGQTLMSQRPPMSPEQAYPKNQMQQPQQQNGSLLGNSLMYNPMMMRRRMYG